MSGRHRVRTSRSNLVIGSIAASVGVSSVLAAAIVEMVSPDGPAATPAPPQAVQQQALSQQGRVIAVSEDSLTTQSADGMIYTFAITPDTTAISGDGQSTSPAASFAVNDEVTVIGTKQGEAVVATAVADTSAVGPQGRPMDYGL
ncbi:hypothetical protein [Mycolicibacterium sp. 120270]|uniref:hypothetical protein n=1 Tax=Mycolicibacterium sp. 120270 TaxID=3090600 RepID=UPI00299EE335|nr:hypothetical protein [Mycolicibacterium sp. 120270]MDX1883955.1 hypothetical protein [Mycolicibacterium sp. 120270]